MPSRREQQQRLGCVSSSSVNSGLSSEPEVSLHVDQVVLITYLIKASLCRASQDPVWIGWARPGPPFRLGFSDQSSILRSNVWGSLRGPHLLYVTPSRSDLHQVWENQKRFAEPVMAAHISCCHRRLRYGAMRPTTVMTRLALQRNAMQSMTSKRPRQQLPHFNTAVFGEESFQSRYSSYLWCRTCGLLPLPSL
jgi:hypothetical protein